MNRDDQPKSGAKYALLISLKVSIYEVYLPFSYDAYAILSKETGQKRRKKGKKCLYIVCGGIYFKLRE